jgi:inorganic pyrophosphatase/exopolyphosphatase
VNQSKLLNSKNNKIVSIYDHHQDEKHNKSNNIIKHIMYPLGSCSTLILNKFYLSNPLLFNFINPFLSISGILIATENFNKKLYNKKWVQLDKFVFNEILYENEHLFPPSFINNRKKYINDYYQKIKKEKYDKIKNLNIGVRGILKKDLKNFEWENGVKAKWSTLQIVYDDIVAKFGERKIIMEMNILCKDSKYNLYIINYKGKGGDKIIYKLYNHSIEQSKYLDFIKRLKASLNNRCFNVIHNNEKMITFEVEPSLSRKHFEPYIRSIFNNK